MSVPLLDDLVESRAYSRKFREDSTPTLATAYPDGIAPRFVGDNFQMIEDRAEVASRDSRASAGSCEHEEYLVPSRVFEHFADHRAYRVLSAIDEQPKSGVVASHALQDFY